MSKKEDTLIRTNESEYGVNYKQHILEQYKIYIEMADRISQRRMLVNTFYTSSSAIVLTIYGIVKSISTIACPFVSLAGLTLTFSWFQMIEKYKQLNSVKYHIINDIELILPISPYSAEYRRCKNNKHKPLTDVEKYLPICFAVLFLLITILNIINII